MIHQIHPEKQWYFVDDTTTLPTPALLVYPERIENNIKGMIRIAGTPERLRPHVKTHKMGEIIKLQIKHGITKFKCATIAEMEMAARSGAKDLLLAIQPVGPNINRFFELKKAFPDVTISCLTDNETTINQLSAMAVQTGLEVPVWLDINNGMNRTGIVPGNIAGWLYNIISTKPGLKAAGFHVYDGHIHDADIEIRRHVCNESFLPVMMFLEELLGSEAHSVKIIAGGSPSFPIHAVRDGVFCSPGTILLGDLRTGNMFQGNDFLPAAVLVTRVVSQPAKNLLCLDLGHKAIASEMPHPRIEFFRVTDYTVFNHSEEHLVLKTPHAENFRTGDLIYGIPYHICPTVALYDSAYVIHNHKVSGEWQIEGRRRRITF
jgi:D-serine deaminase-like pyridoxal phosphate-dependent protein